MGIKLKRKTEKEIKQMKKKKIIPNEILGFRKIEILTYLGNDKLLVLEDGELSILALEDLELSLDYYKVNK